MHVSTLYEKTALPAVPSRLEAAKRKLCKKKKVAQKIPYGRREKSNGRREGSKDVGREMMSRLQSYLDKYDSLSPVPAVLSPAQKVDAPCEPRQTLVLL